MKERPMIELKRLQADRTPCTDMPVLQFRDYESMKRCLLVIFAGWAGVYAQKRKTENEGGTLQ